MATELDIQDALEEVVVDTSPPPPPMPVMKINHIPVYWGTEHDMMEKIEASGVKIYYIIGSEKYTVKNAQGVESQPKYRASTWRVDAGIIGRSVLPANVDDLGLFSAAAPKVSYDLPKMSYAFRQTMDAFFREAHKLHGTEAILVLTFDPSYLATDTPSDGWGFVVPIQENTSVHCAYEMDEAMKRKPANAKLIGTVHSHPEMTAFFSPTDHKDQADWEGLHITYAWKAGGGPTEYHAELVQGGVAWAMNEETVFEAPPLPDVDTSAIEEWLPNVSKKVPAPTTSYMNTGGGTSGGTRVLGPGSATNRPAGYTSPLAGGQTNASAQIKSRMIHLPVGAPDPRVNTIAVVASWKEAHEQCPFCYIPLSRLHWNNGQCISCRMYIMDYGQSPAQFMAMREERKQPAAIHMDPIKAPLPIILWTPKGCNGSKEDTFSDDQRFSAINERIAELNKGNAPK